MKRTIKLKDSLGSIRLNKEFVLCGHPGIMSNRYIFTIDKPGLYNVFYNTKFIKNDYESYNLISEVAIVMDVKDDYVYGELIANKISNQSHGGILICDSDVFSTLPEEFDDDIKLWNFFSNGLCMKKSTSFNSWCSNSIECNIVFVPSHEYYTLYKEKNGNGFLIKCNAFDEL